MRALLVSALACAACTPMQMMTVDAGPDTSCGLDCVAQQRYGLIVNRCFEYTSDPTESQDPPALGARVLPVFTLDGDVKVLPVEYRQAGQLRMRDSFGLKNGELYLMRREFSASSQSVTYRDAADVIVGAKWLQLESGAGETYTSNVKAYVVGQSGNGESTDTSYRASTAAPTTSELKTQVETYTTGVKLLVGESPDHGSDVRRVFVPDVGFVLIASPLALTGGSPVPMVLQKIRDIGSPEGGSADCSLGVP